MDPNLALTSIGGAALSAWALRLLQKWEALPWLTKYTDKINLFVRLALSLGTTIGIAHTWGAAEGGGYIFTMTIPPLMVLLHAIWHIFIQYAITHGWGQILAINDPGRPQAVGPVEINKADGK